MNNCKQDDTLLTVLMAVYNGEQWLGDSIQSIIMQTYKNFEFIIINDGSNDSSLQIINEFAANDSRIRVYTKHNSGLADSLNHGLAKAKGDWVARIDADDICDPQRLEKQLEYSRTDSNLVLIGSGLTLIDDNGHKGMTYHYPNNHSRLMRRLSKGLPFFPHSSAFFKLSAVKKLGGYRTEFNRSQDQDLWLRLGELGKILSIREPLVQIRKHSQQISNDSFGQAQVTYSYMAMTSYYLRSALKTKPLNENQRQEWNNFYEFIRKMLKDRNIYDNRNSIDRLKANISKKHSIFAKSIALVRETFRKPFFIYQYIKFRIFGSNLPKKFAKEWQKYHIKSNG